VLLETGGELVTSSLAHGNEAFDADRIEQLTAEPLGGDAGANALARGMDGN
jgi:hypothetical protein